MLLKSIVYKSVLLLKKVSVPFIKKVKHENGTKFKKRNDKSIYICCGVLKQKTQKVLFV